MSRKRKVLIWAAAILAVFLLLGLWTGVIGGHGSGHGGNGRAPDSHQVGGGSK